jgi:hypothetical protein
MPLTIPRPSALLHSIRLEPFGTGTLFKFSEDLQTRMETLLDRKKADQLTPEETLELESIGELDRIFTHINALLMTQAAA